MVTNFAAGSDFAFRRWVEKSEKEIKKMASLALGNGRI